MRRHLLFFIAVLICRVEAGCPEVFSPFGTTSGTGIDRLLARHRGIKPLADRGKKERFTGIGKRDAYNPTAPFEMAGVEMIAARVESRESERDSEVHFFRRLLDHWILIPSSPVLRLQDPFHVQLGEEHVIGGVEVFEKEDGSLGYKTIFYRGTHLSNLKRFAEGPAGMKDIRLSPLPSGKIVIFTRPQGKKADTDYDAGPGRIGFTTIDTLAELTPEKIQQAKIIEGLFKNEEWGGVNQAIPLDDGKTGILMHIARFDKNGGRHYYPAAMTFDSKTDTYSEVKILLERDDLPGGLKRQSKREGLADVLFSGGIVLHADGTATLYLGAGDAEVYSILIRNPFLPRF